MEDIKANQMYESYEGKKYKIVAKGKNLKKEKVIVCKAMFGEYGIIVKPLNYFKEKIQVDGKEINRFTLIKK
jgi:hypothetical protein